MVDHGMARKSTEREEEMEVYENPPRHTAKQVAEDVAAGMDPDVESVPAQYYDQMRADRDRAVGALARAGFVDHGAEAWKPPLGWGDTGKQRERLIALEDELAEVKAARDELQRRLDAILDRLPEGGVWCYACNRATVPIWCENFYEHIPREYKQMKTTFHCPICKRETHAKDSCVDSLRAIAEGREG